MEYSQDLMLIAGQEIAHELEPNALRDLLTQRIQYLMQYQHQYLFNIFYRIDLNEQKVKAALQLPPEHIYAALADLVIAREQQRMETRKKYGKKN